MTHKRPLEGDESNDNVSEEKRQKSNLQSVVMEAMKNNNLQKFLVVLEPLVRRVVSEEVERAIAKYLPPTHGLRIPPKHLQSAGSKTLRLQFMNKLALPLFTGSKVEGEQGTAIRVVLQDAATGQLVTVGDEASAKIDIVVLEGDFANDDDEDWDLEEFQNHEVKEREGKPPLLQGELAIVLKEGVGILGELVFTDNSSWIRSRKFRLGVKISPGYLKGLRVREAKTEAFNVKDHRGELYKKHYPPALSDEVWRLEKIGKDGAYHRRLCENKILTVEDFLIMYSTGPSKLREIFGNTMSTKTWDSIIEHSKTCILNETQRVYYPDDSHSIGVILNTIYQPLGIVRSGSYVPSSSLSETEQVYMDRLVQEAYNDLSSVCKLPATVGHQEFEGVMKSKESTGGAVLQPPASSKKNSRLKDGAGNFLFSGGNGYPTYDDRMQMEQLQQREQFQQMHEQRVARNLQESAVPPFRVSAGYMSQNESMSPTLGLSLQQSLLNAAFSPESLGFLGYGQYQQREYYNNGQDGNFNQHAPDMSDDYSEGRGYGLWGNEEVQLMPTVNKSNQMGFSTSYALQGDVRFPLSDVISRSYRDGREDLHRRALMGWFKLKAVLKWGVFTKKRLSSRQQVQIQELDG